ncbi:polysaccharide biosynthesis/export family protein [Candidatus Sulfidibacterium hydrothermale]|uniref:polysaccharide biosynthesis/export family protein n=1 Tax=Candidatus Sulfidibacterium hydrothermale TaxID=2875962 RepID=UPI00293D8161|nr:polysaccharide biosynthesis/export family protein [Candidatus Sulfidibacterium hydrothermale]
MKKHTFSYFKFFFWIVLVSIFLTSCVPQKKILYMQVKNEADTMSSFKNQRKINYRIQPGDNLYIRVVSMDEKTNLFLNSMGGGQYSQNITSDASVYLNSYMVSTKGTIQFPLTGEVYVKNLTVAQVKDTIQKKLENYLKESVVIVKLVNFNITLLGEVKRPGQYKIYQNNINLFEAVSMAGDLSDFAKRSDVTIIRQTKNGSKVIHVDMTKKDILSSPYFYLKPNDIVYVPPLKGKQFSFATFPYGVVFSALSTALLLISFFKN